MSSKRGGGRPVTSANNDMCKGKSISEYQPKLEQLTQGIADTKLNSGQDDGEWEVYARKPKNKAGSSAGKPWGGPSQNSNPRAWSNADMAPKPGNRSHGGVGRSTGNPWQTQNANFRRPAGRGNGRPQVATSGYESYSVNPNPLIRPPLEHGWNWQSRPGAMQSNITDEIALEDLEKNDEDDVDGEEEDSDALEDSDDDLMSDDYDSDASQKSHETRKKSKWFKKFFGILDNLTVEQINEPERQWHCPACQGGPGAIDWYRGLQPLMTHAKTKGSKRVKIHRELAILLDEELHRRGTSVIPAGEIFGKWKGLKEEEKDHEIVWPPMVIIQNTKLEQDDNDKWIGMGNQELLDYFSTYAAVKARHAYGPQGHRGMSVLIFEASASGYLEAERLHKHFAEQGTDRDSWFIRPILYLPGGNRQLYGYMATKEDLDFFNKHAQGKSRLKYDLRSYQEMVVHQIRQMNEDNQQLIYFKNKAVKGAKHTKALEESIGMMSEKLRKTMEENRIVRRRTKMQHEETKEEMYMQEKFFKDQMKIIHESRDASEEDFERKQQEEREKVKQSSTTGPVNSEEYRLKVDEYLKFVEVQDKEMENFVAEKDKLCYAHDASIAAMRRRHWEEEMQLEQKFDEELANLMEKYSPS
ncbi:protein SUPPRESSOR OF GENE SILENCING 3 isoform X2 [Cajanus cajan]|nr:protein SUPPRESSOR OF GENE SILENCING 3 isoform X2 [Cajanus cajan]XP_020211313.1 protein SUPPRESSOR OF GENE SILENCING 3 isoform X2 [Cajanus cajan]XP_020211314.1 protein SUPPRESSOR OF GENE SILENCING 3 isoform X2 [Cajanus cajan]XP_029126641.1 protein SUPPRESSOR OF GENE SILENCING 3 isoform X2 [Cajanus cajan]